jgi:hypothetical protein
MQDLDEGLLGWAECKSQARGGNCRGRTPRRAPAEELLIVGPTPDAANELAGVVGRKKVALSGWHRLTLSQLAAAIAAPASARQLTPLSSIRTETIVTRIAGCSATVVRAMESQHG